ncbi:MAG: hypothetical protein ABL931_14705 [Usitatibacteraceae bacterium]
MTAKWIFPETAPFQVQGRDLSEDNFAQEDRSGLEILIREVLQNPLDARALENTGPVRVRIAVMQPGTFDAEYLRNLLGAEYGNRLVASGGEALPEVATASVLVLEDFGTTGLEGNWNDQNADGPQENWNAFWFREGEGAKAAAGSNGRAGQGKITYYRIGAARAVFGQTVRASDGKALLMGRGAFRRVYPYGGIKYLRHSFWCAGELQPLPLTAEAEIEAFRNAFSLVRCHEPGLSLVIPFPVDFDPKIAIQTIVSEFYFPIAAGNLELSIGGMEISARNVDAVANLVLPDVLARSKKSSFTNGFRKLALEVIGEQQSGFTPIKLNPGWDTTSCIREDALPPGAIELLRARLESGDHISVRCPVKVRPKRSAVKDAWFDVHLQMPEDLDRVEEAYIRRDLLIGSESHLASSSNLQKARAITIVRDDTLSAFLADAEEPTHLKWNASRPRLAEDYSNPQATLRAVRNAAPRLLALICVGLVKRDIKALAKYFTRAAEEGKRHAPKGNRAGERDTSIDNQPPAPTRKPFRITTGTDRVQVLVNGSVALTRDDLPVSCSLEIAYEGLDLAPFDAYDPFDFDLANPEIHSISVRGANITRREGNKISFEVVDPDFLLEVPGFDPNIRLRAKLDYMERDDGQAFSEE